MALEHNVTPLTTIANERSFIIPTKITARDCKGCIVKMNHGTDLFIEQICRRSGCILTVIVCILTPYFCIAAQVAQVTWSIGQVLTGMTISISIMHL